MSINLYTENGLKNLVPNAVQTDWSVQDISNPAYLRNKPTTLSSFQDDLGSSPIHTHEQYVTNADISNKADRSELPTKVSDLTNDTGFITNLVNNLANYYNKSETYNKTEVNELIEDINKFNVKIVTVLPTTDIDTHTIYFVPKIDSETNDHYDEYMYINSTWELIGSTSIDLSNYYNKSETYNKTEVNGLISQKVNIAQGSENVGKILKVNQDGDLELSTGGGGGSEYYAGEGIDIDEENYISVDDTIADKDYVDILVDATIVDLNLIDDIGNTLSDEDDNFLTGYTFQTLNYTPGDGINIDYHEISVDDTVARTSDLNSKVDKISGKGLSSNDYTNEEKTKLSGIEIGANKYVLPTASSSVLGGVKVGNNLAINNGILSGNYSNATTSANGLMSSTDKTTLNSHGTSISNLNTTVSNHTTSINNINSTLSAIGTIYNISDFTTNPKSITVPAGVYAITFGGNSQASNSQIYAYANGETSPWNDGYLAGYVSNNPSAYMNTFTKTIFKSYNTTTTIPVSFSGSWYWTFISAVKIK